MKTWVIKRNGKFLGQWGIEGKLAGAVLYRKRKLAKDVLDDNETVVPVEIKLIKQKGK